MRWPIPAILAPCPMLRAPHPRHHRSHGSHGCSSRGCCGGRRDDTANSGLAARGRLASGARDASRDGRKGAPFQASRPSAAPYQSGMGGGLDRNPTSRHVGDDDRRAGTQPMPSVRSREQAWSVVLPALRLGSAHSLDRVEEAGESGSSEGNRGPLSSRPVPTGSGGLSTSTSTALRRARSMARRSRSER
jgi:hypothetical protein